MHSFHAFIDESGDEGFKFKPPPEKASSEWFVLSAVLIRSSQRVPASNLLNKTIVPLEAVRKAPIHFTRLNHDLRKVVCMCVASLPVTLVHVCINKKSLSPEHALNADGRLHRYAIRLLLERISWFCRDNYKASDGKGRCKLHFSRCKNLSYVAVSGYLQRLKAMSTSVSWEFIDTDNYEVRNHEDSIWLRTADIAASAAAKGLELGENQLCEDAYARILRPVAYTRNRKCAGYGLKLLPEPWPEVEKERDNRYAWLSLYK